ncbi:hypothetical protein Tco_1555204 [Tanacetum coccineum]
MVDEFAPPKFFASVREMEHDQLFTEFNVRVARQMSLSAEVRMRAEYNVKEKRRLKSVVERKVELLKVKEGEIENLKAQLLLRETKAAKAIRLRAEASNFEAVTELENAAAGKKERELTDLNSLITSVKSQNDNLMDRVHELEISSSGLQEKVTMYENCMDQLKNFQDDRMKVVNDKFDKLYTDFVEMALHLEEKFYPHLLTTVFSHRWLLTHGMELVIVKCLNSPEYLSALRAAISKANEKGMQDGLSSGIVHGKEGIVLTDGGCFIIYPSAELITLLLGQHLSCSEKLGLIELQPDVDQLMVPIHRSSGKVVLGATALSLALDVSGTEVNSDIVPATANTTTALSTTFASTSSIAPISVDDYEVVGADDQVVADGNVASFPNVDDVDLNILQLFARLIEEFGFALHQVRSRLMSDLTTRDVEWEPIKEERLEEPKEGWMLGESKKTSIWISSRMLIVGLVPWSQVTLVKARLKPSEAQHKFISSVISTRRGRR